jgi:ABC-type polysaccharide/polyol phosphate export permease
MSTFVYKTSGYQHENYLHLIWILALSDFKLRYQNSILGYIWAILTPLLLFMVLNFVFSSIFSRGLGNQFYSMGLLIGLILYSFFQDGTTSGMRSLQAKSSLVTKIYLSRWTIIMASTIHSAMIFLANLLVIIIFLIWYRFLPTLNAILLFFLFSCLMYLIILSISMILAPLFIKFRDIAMIWEVGLRIMFYASPIFYPLQMLPEWIQKILLINPVAFIIHFTKESMFNNHFLHLWQFALFFISSAFLFIISIWVYKKLIPKVAENL